MQRSYIFFFMKVLKDRLFSPGSQWELPMCNKFGRKDGETYLKCSANVAIACSLHWALVDALGISESMNDPMPFPSMKSQILLMVEKKPESYPLH